MKKRDLLPGIILLLMMSFLDVTAQIPSGGLVAWYSFTGNATDGSGNQYDGTVNGATLCPDRFQNAGRAYSFTGSNIEIPSGVLNNMPSGTLSAFVYVNNLDLQQTIIDKTETNVINYFQVIIDANNQLRTIINSSETHGQDNFLFSNALFHAGSWYHIAVTWDGSALKIYINGGLDNSKAVTDGIPDGIRQTFLGMVDYGCCYLDGNLDDVRIYNRALADTEIQQLYLENAGSCPSTVTYEGKTYNALRIGLQCWFQENLNVGTLVDGMLNQTNNGIIEKYCYNNNESNCDTYGGLYQWEEVMQGSATPGAQGICPPGWHVPADADWLSLSNYLGGDAVAGGKMKEEGLTHWAYPNEGATNESGFTALPGGYRFRWMDQSFGGISTAATFWSSTQFDEANTWFSTIYHPTRALNRSVAGKNNGWSARCLKDNTPAPLINFTAPAGSGPFLRGTPMTITWTQNLACSDKIEVFTVAGTWFATLDAAFTGTEGTNSTVWNIPAAIPPGTYKVRITMLDGYGTGYSRESVPFNVVIPITITAPVANANWEPGKIHKIRWMQTFTGPVHIDLYNHNNPAQNWLIADAVTGNTFIWTIPALPVGVYDLKIWRAVTLDVHAECTINIVVSGDPFITALSPFGGETWQRGTSKPITWDDNLPREIKIDLYTATGIYNSTLKTAAPGNSYNWYIPNTLRPGTYMLKLSNPYNAACYDFSGVFTICAGTPGGTISIVAPVTGSKWQRGASHLIQWTKTCTENVAIELINSAGSVQMIRYSVAGLSYNWYIPYSQPTGAYTIRISSILDPVTIYATSSFYITSSAGGTISIVTPAAGSSWERGAVHMIQWDKTFPENVRIDLVHSGGGVQTLKTSAEGQYFEWYIPWSQAPGTYTMKISSILNGNLYDAHLFTITLSPGGTITVTNPHLGDIWERGANHQITWTKTMPENVRIDLCNGSGGWISTLKTSTEALSLNWYIPFSQAPGTYTIRVSSTLNPSGIYDLSDVFTISLNAPGTTVTVTAPNGGEIWAVGTSHLITWTKTFNENVKLDLCDGNGNYLKTLRTSTEAHSFNWYIPYSQATGNYKIKATSIYDPEDYDLSDTPFQIAMMDFAVFPNPVTGNLMTLKFTNPPQDGCKIGIYDRFGNRVFTTIANAENIDDIIISTSDLLSDIYLIVVTAGDLRVTKKVIIQH